MRHLSIILFVLIAPLTFISPTFAESSHSHDGGHSHGPVSGEDAGKMAEIRVNKLAKAGKIPESWTGIKANSVVQKEYSKGPEWVVTLKNNNVTDVKKQTLYMFFTLDGVYIAANYSGN